MNGKIKAVDLAIAHYLICKRTILKTELLNPSALKMIEMQLLKMSEQSAAYKGAFLAYWFYNRKPFSSGNLRSATVLGIIVSGIKANKKSIENVSVALAGGANVEAIKLQMVG